MPNRDKEHKKVKDICDIFALLWYSNIKHGKVKEGLVDFASLNDIRKCLKSIDKKDLQGASSQIGHTAEEIERVIELLK